MKGSRVIVFLAISAVCARTVFGDNRTLWEGLMSDCRPAGGSYSCVQSTLQGYLEKALDGPQLKLTDSIVFTKNSNKYTREANTNSRESRLLGTPREEPEFGALIEDLEETTAPEPHKSLRGISDVLYDRAVVYLMTHDLKLGLPGGGALKISPRSIEDDGGALVKLTVEDDDSRQEASEKPEARIFFKRIKQLLKKKLLTSFLAALLIIGLIKVKLLFLAPLLLGVGTAKKILLKVLLFVFPALAHLFKLCAYYHHHHSKYHLHHHHEINHHHHHTPPPIHASPTYHHEDYVYPEYPPPHPDLQYGGGIHHRSELDDNLLTSWGIDPPPADSQPPPGYQRQRPVESTNRVHVKKVSAVNSDGTSWSKQGGGGLNMGIQYDPFYSPILERLDEVFGQLGFQEEGCKERLVCSMYKSPARFSPHSNLVSAQLSRDPAELQRPAYSNSAVVRFYRYVQAARDGQDMKDCLILYPVCSVVTE